MSEEVKVRIGTKDDIHAVMELAVLACRENGISVPNTEKLLADVWAGLTQDFGVMGLIGEPGQQLEGL